MAWGIVKLKRNLKSILIGAIVFCFLVTAYVGLTRLPNSNKVKVREHKGKHFSYEATQKNEDYNTQTHRLAIIVPFRDRFEELLVFGPFIHRFLNLKRIPHDIIVVNQVDNYRFNRASLINAGYLYATNKLSPPSDYIAMHDVDLLPLNNELPYGFPDSNTVTHVAAPGLHPKYNYPTFIGGILIVPSTVFQTVNGMSNVYWGWGLEDDEFYVRLKQNKIQVKRPLGLTTGRTNTFRHNHSAKIRSRDMTKCFDQWNKTRKRDRLTGLHNVNYTLESTSHLMFDEAPVIFLNVRLHCDMDISPWCDCNHPGQTNLKSVNSPNKSSNKQKRRRVADSKVS